tara:strand:- start:1870 stop:2100 length:231 start_codon:yes stop_codon:yes gene_type:complete
MSVADLIQTDFESNVVNLDASKRSFQRSIIVKQDRNKSGVLSLLENDIVETSTGTSSQSSAQGQTIRPTQPEGGAY